MPLPDPGQGHFSSGDDTINTDRIPPSEWRGLTWIGGIGVALALFYVVVQDPVAVGQVIADFITLAVVVAVAVAVYFAPAIIADRRGHHNHQAIFALNLFAGWTVIAWVVALVWAFTKVDRT